MFRHWEDEVRRPGNLPELDVIRYRFKELIKLKLK